MGEVRGKAINEILKEIAVDAINKAEKAISAYASDCEIDEERILAFDSDKIQGWLNITDLLRNACNLAIERDKLCKNNPTCPDCGTNQVQIIDVGLQQWICRRCKNAFSTDFEI